MRYYLCSRQVQQDTYFPIHSYKSLKDAEADKHWQEIGPGEQTIYVIKTSKEMAILLKEEKLRQSVYTNEAWENLTKEFSGCII